MSFGRAGALSLLSGTALWLSFPNFSWFPLAWFALIPFLYFLIERPPWKLVLIGHLIMALVYFGGVLYWIPRVLVVYGSLGSLVAGALFTLMLVALAFFLLPFTLLTRWVAGKSGRAALIAAPGFWVLTELLRNYYAVNGFPWALLGYSQFGYSWIIQIADLSGVYLISAFIVAGSGAVVSLIRYRSFRPLLIFIALFAAANLYGIYRTHVWQPAQSGSLKVALVQPNIELFGDREHYAGKYFETLPAYYREAIAQGVQWVIFPEAPNPFFYEEDFYFRTFWERHMSEAGTYLLLNTTFVEKKAAHEYFNSALLLGPGGAPEFRYDKIHLVPFGEYVPMADWLGTLFEPLVQEVAGFSPGRSLETGSVRGVQFAALICYEGIFPELSRAFAREGVEVLVNITNDSWYGETAAPRQHLEIAAFRSIEIRKPLLRCANSGFSAVIDPLGRLTQELGLFEEGVLISQVSGNQERTIYSYIGEWFNILFVTLSALMSLVAGRRR